MVSDAIEDETPGDATRLGGQVSDASVLDDARSLLHELLGLAYDRLLLAGLETRRAGESLVSMFVAGVMVAILLCSAWMGLMAVAALWLIENGVTVNGAILLAVAFNLLLVLILFQVMRSKSRCLQFPATLRSLKTMPQGRQDKEKL